MGYEKKTDHVAESVATLLSQFQPKARLAGLIALYAQQIQDLEDALSDILTETTIDTAVGAQLDALGSVVGEERLGRSDLQYSTAIRARQILNTSEGTIETIIALIQAITSGLSVEITEWPIMAFEAVILDYVDPTLVDTVNMGALVAEGKPAGVGMDITWFESTNPFTFDTAGKGFDEGELVAHQEF